MDGGRMPFRLFFAILILFFSKFASAEEPTALSTAITSPDQGFILIPASLCKETKYQSFCKASKLPMQMEGRVLEVKRAEAGLAYFYPSNGPSDDHYELTCYRCAFSKIDKKNCGRYREIHGKSLWAKNCPKDH